MPAPLIFNRIKQGAEKVIDWIAVLFFVVVFFVALAQIIMRWIFRNPIVWSEELIRLMYVWICYIGWTMASRNKSHICITALISRLPPLGQKIMQTFNCILVIIFSVFMVWFGIKMTEVGGRGMAVTLPINFALVYVSAPIANFIILLYQVLDLVNIWKKIPAEPQGALS
ncbi:MAG: TRAP transporter small permease [Treponema sp.]|jgi:C4-dicarboxylate transporter DctQ subunit|nr:TRAP transporter small permease [Treponema sp.]